LIESQRQAASMILIYRYRLLPTQQQHRVLETILESQRQLYNAALEERNDAYRKSNVTRTYFDQTKALTEWRQDDPEASALPVTLQRATLKRLARSSLAKDVHDASWAKFISCLRYKAARAGARLIEVDPRNTTQDCSGCGAKVPKELGDRQHECPHCGLSIDRDLNAARNILHRAGVGPGLRNVAGGGMRAGGNLSEPTASRQETLESH